MTNFERIKGLTAEQMAMFIDAIDTTKINFTKMFDCENCKGERNCRLCFFRWLKSETRRIDGLDILKWGDQMTNLERIKSFNVQQMGAFLSMIDLGNIDYSKMFCKVCDGTKNCEECFTWWLNSDSKQPQGLDYDYDWSVNDE